MSISRNRELTLVITLTKSFKIICSQTKRNNQGKNETPVGQTGPCILTEILFNSFYEITIFPIQFKTPKLVYILIICTTTLIKNGTT